MASRELLTFDKLDRRHWSGGRKSWELESGIVNAAHRLQVVYHEQFCRIQANELNGIIICWSAQI